MRKPETAVCRTARTVVWEVGECESRRQTPMISIYLLPDFAQHGYILTGASPQAALITGRLQPTTRVSVATRNLKEVLGKHLL